MKLRNLVIAATLAFTSISANAEDSCINTTFTGAQISGNGKYEQTGMSGEFCIKDDGNLSFQGYDYHKVSDGVWINPMPVAVGVIVYNPKEKTFQITSNNKRSGGFAITYMGYFRLPN